MNIVVLVKQVPDSGSERSLAGDNTVERQSANNVINEMDEYAIEETSKVLAAALGTLNPDIVIAGAESTDGRVQVLPHMIAERLGVAALTGARKLTVDGGTLTIERQTEEGYEVVTAATPAVVSVWDTINEPRYPSFKGIMAAKKKPVQTLALADLGVDAGDVGFAGATSEVVEHAKRPPRSGGQKVTDDGNGGVALVEFLSSEKFV
jgi:electron transfer flavoprotein beta subunit